jgi:hypothetical protein
MLYMLLFVLFISCYLYLKQSACAIDIFNVVIVSDEFYKSGNLKKGNITFPDGESVEGTFYDMCGGALKEGKRIYPDGVIEEGKFDIEGYIKEGKKISLNEVIDGEFIAGNFKKGTVTFLDGEVLNGNFVNGILEKGYISYPNKTILCVNTQVEKELKEKKYIERIIIIIIFSIFCYYCGKYFYKNKIEPKPKLELGEKDLCSICLDKKKTHGYFPCGHICLCNDCSKRINIKKDKCIICREKIKFINIAYF